MTLHQFDFSLTIDTDDLASLPQKLVAIGQRFANEALARERRALSTIPHAYGPPRTYRPTLSAAQRGKQSYRSRHKHSKPKRVTA